jgi:integrase
MESIKVKVVEFGDRKHYQMQYVDPITRRKKTLSTKIERDGTKAARAAAEKAAGKWEAELREGRYCEPSKTTWVIFRQRYEDEVLTGQAETTDKKVGGVFNAVAEILNPKLLRDLTPDRLSYLQSKLRETGRSESTIAGHLAHLRAALQWAVNMGMLLAVPKISKPKRAKATTVMKGRPITREEFERMLAAVPKALRGRNSRKKQPVDAKPAVIRSWRHYLEGLWRSGLRLEESLELCWDRNDKLSVDFSGKRPMMRIPAELEKGNKDRLLPVAPEFAEFLLATPKAKRTGFVFNPAPRRTRSLRLTPNRVGDTVTAIGRAAGVKVSSKMMGETEIVKYASAHDLRRSFGERWATRVMPQVLMVLMRHESIETTMRYYVGRNAQTMAEVLWDAYHQASGNSIGNNAPARSQKQKRPGA